MVLFHLEVQQNNTDTNDKGNDSEEDGNGGRDSDESFNYDSTDAK